MWRRRRPPPGLIPWPPRPVGLPPPADRPHAQRVRRRPLGAPGGATPGGTKVTEFGPVPRISAPAYLLRINEATGPSGAITSIHSHPGSESFYVLRGEQSIRGPKGVTVMKPGDPTIGQGEQPMQVWSSGTADLHSLVMFVVDAARPFSTPSKFDH